MLAQGQQQRARQRQAGGANGGVARKMNIQFATGSIGAEPSNLRAIMATALRRHIMSFGRFAEFVIVVMGLLLVPLSTSAATTELRLATPRTLNDSGLLDALLGAFQRETGLRVKPFVAGTGQASRLAERGDGDLVWFSVSPRNEASGRCLAPQFACRGPPDSR